MPENNKGSYEPTLTENHQATHKSTMPTKQEETYKSAYGVYKHGTVAADSKLVSDIGRDLMQLGGGNAIDVAAAVALATGLAYPHSSGIGGGFFAVVYHKEHGFHAVDGREVVPSLVTADMFTDKASIWRGGKTICVPGLAKGLYEMHTKFGSLPWTAVVEPSIKLLRDGVPLSKMTHFALARDIMPIIDTVVGFDMFLDENKKLKPAGSLIYYPQLLTTYETLSSDPESFYEGALAQDIVKDVQDRDGVMEQDDMSNYKCRLQTTLSNELPGGYVLHTHPPPAGGSTLNTVMSVMAGYNPSPDDLATDEARTTMYHRLIEAARHATVVKAELGDGDYVKEANEIVKWMSLPSASESIRKQINDKKTELLEEYCAKHYCVISSGTTHSSILDTQGNAVAITASINQYFGSFVIGERTGIFFNNQMADFSHNFHPVRDDIPVSVANLVQPGKRAMSTIAPAVIFDESKNRVALVVGASGEQKITEAMALSILDVLYFNKTVPQSLDTPRIYQDVVPLTISHDTGFPEDIIERLKEKGHKVVPMYGLTVVQMIHVTGEGETTQIVAGADHRKQGEPSGF